jgi:MFS family permease
MSFWWPFLPLYMQQLDGGTEAEALAWVAIAMAGSGIARLLSGPIWGVIADRYGRKVMFVRALYAATAVTLLAAAAREPWHLAVAFTIQGIFSGFVPAGIALTSVSVPQSRLMGSLGTIQGAQFAGNTAGPALGAIVAAALGLRGAMIAGA